MKATTSNSASYKFNKGLILKKAWLLHKENLSNGIESNFSLCLKQAWDQAKQVKQNIISKLNNTNDTDNNKPVIIENKPSININLDIDYKQNTIKPVILNTVNSIIDFNKVYRENYSKVLASLTFKLNGNSELAQDLCSEVFVKIYEKLPNYNDGLGKLNTWIYTIAYRHMIDYLRTSKEKYFVNVQQWNDNETGREIFQFIDETDLENESDKTIKNNQLKDSINLLKDNQKQALNLYYNENKSYIEIAEILNISLTNVKQTIHRAKKELETKKAAIYNNVLV